MKKLLIYRLACLLARFLRYANGYISRYAPIGVPRNRTKILRNPGILIIFSSLTSAIILNKYHLTHHRIYENVINKACYYFSAEDLPCHMSVEAHRLYAEPILIHRKYFQYISILLIQFALYPENVGIVYRSAASILHD